MQARNTLHFATFLFLHLLLSSCSAYRVPTEHYHRLRSDAPDPELHCKNSLNGAKSPLYNAIPRHRCQLKWYDVGHWTTWALFGNDDDGIFGEAARRPYKPEHANTPAKALGWWVRNPLHNLFHYTLGSAGRVNSEFTLLNLNRNGVELLKYRPVAKKNYGGDGSSFYAALHGGKPFLSLRLCYFGKFQTECYLGWRKHGAFGLKFHPFKRCESTISD
jgi:hypothetical protein